MSRNLVIVRAGDASTHTGWLGADGERTWDIIVSYYGDNPDIFRDHGQRRIDGKGAKWPVLHALATTLEQEIEAYDYIWLPDDDLVADVHSINKLFAVCEEFALDLAQPSLTHDSIINHMTTVRNHALRLRYTTFVEVMAPCFSRRFFKRCAPSFAANISGWGLDYLWPSWAENLQKVAIVDEVSVRHTRSHGALYDIYKASGTSPQEDFARLVQKEKLRPIQMITGGVSTSGETYAIWNGQQKKLIEALITGYLPELAGYPQHIYKAIYPLLNNLALQKSDNP